MAASAAAAAPAAVDNGNFIILSSLGKGSFGEVFYARDRRTGAAVAVKRELVDGSLPTPPQLHIEYKVLSLLQTFPGVPRLYGFFQEDGWSYLVMQRLGDSLETLRAGQVAGYLPSWFCRQVALEALDRLQALHSLNIVHRDIKPDNFLVGRDADKQLYLVDFGLCKALVDPDTGAHVADRLVEHTVGTARYTSIRAHGRRQQTRRDDLESLAYMLIYLAKGWLPWQSSRGVKLEDVPAVKRGTKPEELCAGLPAAYLITLECAFSLKFEECPPYSMLADAWDKEGGDLARPAS